MHVRETSLHELISGIKQFRVPLFQRPYTWAITQHQQLWRDILRQYELVREGAASPGQGHFIGSFVLAPTPSSASVPAFLVVDGQQRLTTLTVALCALRDAAVADNPHAFERVTNQFLTNPYSSGDDRWKLVPTAQDKDAYVACVEGRAGDAEGTGIGEAYRYFAVELAKLDVNDEPLDLHVLQTVLVSRLAIVEIAAQEGDNVHRIFESLNATGLDLTQADLLRNYLFMLLPTRGELVYDEVWVPMQRHLGSDHLADLARVDLQRRGIEARDDDVYRSQQERIAPIEHDEAAVEAELRDLALRARHYKCIIDPSYERSPAVARVLTFLVRWGATTTYPVLMCLYERREDGLLADDEMVKALGYIESFLVRRLLVGTPSNSLHRIFLQLVGQLRRTAEAPTAREIRSFLSTERKFWATDDDLSEAVLGRPFFLQGRANQRRLVLERLEQSFGHKEQTDLAALSLSIEHIMPRTLSTEWLTSLAGESDDPEGLHRELVDTLGNLTLTGYNSELSNSPLERKQQIYRHSHLSLNRSLPEAAAWGRKEIEARAAEIAAAAISIWPGPVEGVSQTTVGFDWSRVRAAIAALPAGRWTAYVDLALLVGTSAQAVGNHIATNPAIPGAWRILTADGQISDGFRWPHPDDTRDPVEVLRAEGVRFDTDGRADDAQRQQTTELDERLRAYEDPDEARRPKVEDPPTAADERLFPVPEQAPAGCGGLTPSPRSGHTRMTDAPTGSPMPG